MRISDFFSFKSLIAFIRSGDGLGNRFSAMKLRSSAIIGLLFFMACPGRGWADVESYSETLVYSATSIKGKGAKQFEYSYFSLPMVPPSSDAGVLTGVGIGTLGNSNALWTANQFTNGYYLEITSAPNEGLTADIAAVDAIAKRIILTNADFSGIVQAGATYVIRKHHTIGSIFGETNSVGLLGGLNAVNADNVLIFVPQSQLTVTIFYHSSAQTWRRGFNSAKDEIIRPEQGIMIRRRGAGDTTLYMNGAVKQGPLKVPIHVGYNLLGTVKAGRSIALQDLGLYTGNMQTGVFTNANALVADNLLLLNPDGSTLTYYHRGDMWRRGFTNANAVLIPPVSTFFVRRRDRIETSGFTWTIPPEN